MKISNFLKKYKKNQKGFSLVEILLAIAIFSMVTVSVIYLLIDASYAYLHGKHRATATFLAEEGVEAAQNIRDSGWNNLAVGNHGLKVLNNEWVFDGESDTDPTGIFTRQVAVTEINEDKRLATVTVSWNLTTIKLSNVTLVSYFNNWRKTTETPPPNWEEPKIVKTIGTGNIYGNKNPNGIFVKDNYVYLVTEEANANDPEFFIFDISDPENPVKTGYYKVGGKVNGIYVVGDYAYLATSADDKELVILNVSDPANVTLAKIINISGNQNGLDVVVLDNYAYLVSEANPSDAEFYIFDVIDPENTPEIPVGKYELNANVNSIALSNNFAYLGTADNDKEVQVLRIEDKSNPTFVTSHNFVGTSDVNDLSISGNYLYAGTTKNGSGSEFYSLKIVPTDNPDQINLETSGDIEINGDVNGVLADGANQQVFLATGVSDQEFYIVNASDPTNLSKKSSLDLAGIGVKLSYNGVYVYMASKANNEELVIISPGT